MPPHASSTTFNFLDLPPEIREKVFLLYFRSVTIVRGIQTNHGQGSETPLAILQACRQIYHEAAPLVLPNTHVFCKGNAAVIDVLGRLSPAQITQIRHLIVHHCPIGFKLFPNIRDSQIGPANGNLQQNHNPDDISDIMGGANHHEDEFGNGVRYFHLGEILELFPGLQLDLLEVRVGDTRGGTFISHQIIDCFGSLLEADGYRRLWVDKTPSDGSEGYWPATTSSWRWKRAVDTKFKPHASSMIQIQLRPTEWEQWDRRQVLHNAVDAGITLVEAAWDRCKKKKEGHGREEDADFIIDRGDANFIVKPDSDRVLRCIERYHYHDETPDFLKRASDALRKLFRENSWDTIKAMDGFNDGANDDGEAAYLLRYSSGGGMMRTWNATPYLYARGS